MHQTRRHFTHEQLLAKIRDGLRLGLKRCQVDEVPRAGVSNRDCLLSGRAVFTFKYASLLQFDKDVRREKEGPLKQNLRHFFGIRNVPCDTYLRERLDRMDYRVCRPAFTHLFALLQRARLLDHFRFGGDHYLVSLDGTGVFSSSSVHCPQCCRKEHRDGATTYYHHLFAGALVHPDQKVVYPFAPEPILNTDGAAKNDCERNAAKRWIADFRREHPHLKAIVLGDGLFSNQPFIELLQAHNLRFILSCKAGDHQYLADWVKRAEEPEMVRVRRELPKGLHQTYALMQGVPLHGGEKAPLVTVVQFTETKKTKTSRWMWVTDLDVTPETLVEFVKGGRARWRIENETFNTLKNQGYAFEHNFGHGYANLTTLFSHLLMLAFFVDQCLQAVNKRVQAALQKCGARRTVWMYMLIYLNVAEIADFESLYEAILHPPPMKLGS